MLAPAGCEPYGHFFLFMNYKNKLSEATRLRELGARAKQINKSANQ